MRSPATTSTISMAAEAGQLQLNAFEPIIAHCLFQSLTHLNEACRTLVTSCVVGITANEQRLYESVTNSIGIITALNPYIGYAASARIAKRRSPPGGRYPIWLSKAACSQLLKSPIC